MPPRVLTSPSWTKSLLDPCGIRRHCLFFASGTASVEHSTLRIAMFSELEHQHKQQTVGARGPSRPETPSPSSSYNPCLYPPQQKREGAEEKLASRCQTSWSAPSQHRARARSSERGRVGRREREGNKKSRKARLDHLTWRILSSSHLTLLHNLPFSPLIAQHTLIEQPFNVSASTFLAGGE